MEHTLGELSHQRKLQQLHVLILVLVEHTLGGSGQRNLVSVNHVLILVLVEHTLGVAAAGAPAVFERES